MKILVTGGAGFIGSHIVDALIQKGHDVLVVDNLSTGKKENINPKAEFEQIDITDSGVEDVFSKYKPDALFHLAAQIDVRKSVEDPIGDAKINIIGSLGLIGLAKKYKVKKTIFSSTGGALYGETDLRPTKEDHPTWPVSPYGIGKLTVENYLNYYYQECGLEFVSLRYANVYGPRQNALGEAGVVAIFCHQLINKQQPVINGDGKQTRDYVYVADVVDANIKALESKKVGFYNVGTSTETDVNVLAEMIKKSLNSDIEITHGPAKKGEQQTSSLDYSKIKKELGWQPKTSLEEGIKKTAEWFLAKGK